MSGSQMISETMLLLTLSPVRAWPKSRDITTEQDKSFKKSSMYIHYRVVIGSKGG